MRTKYFPTENIESKTIANVRTIGFSDRKIPKVSTKFFSQAKLALKQNFGSKFYKIFPGLKFYSPTSRRLRIVLGSKLYKPLQVWGLYSQAKLAQSVFVVQGTTRF